MPSKNCFFDSSLKAELLKAGLVDFDAFWNLERDWIEPPNHRRKGWSGVSRLELPDTNIPPLFVKRQENHNTRTLLHPLSGVPTYLREVQSIVAFRKHNIPTLTPVYYGERIEDGNHQAILITQALDDYQDMWSLCRAGNEQKTLLALKELAEATWLMHSKGLAHYCLYPNHVFVRFHENKPEVRMIDLEKARRDPLKSRMRLKDLDCFLRHAGEFGQTARQFFVDSYMAAGPVAQEKTLRARLEKRIIYQP
ncbi:lipopolysaccharide kinase InaA family protein [Parendozoicomonas sp. Alg238-R29]|uniref:lipopolysaccharide kinase InaA family protein n=1 Tax=Parendozoicomonas sp. Alg238-R29 TaxID=2993446 RepID=UPI00248E7A09|nr:lipopolysaccharide kinase InaA family protein [Parendozoicomonas sp. Alg238-R29]